MKLTRAIYLAAVLLGGVVLTPTVQPLNSAGSGLSMPGLSMTLFKAAEAQRRGGGGRGGARTQPARTPNRSVNRRSNNVNVNRNVNVNVNHRNYRRGGRGAAFVAGVATGLVIGSVVSTLPTGCRTVITAGVTYHSCGGTYYRRYYEGTNVTYVVVEAP